MLRRFRMKTYKTLIWLFLLCLGNFLTDHLSCKKKDIDSELFHHNGKRISLPSPRGNLNVSEKFTIVIMSYMKENDVLETTLLKLQGLPFLNKIVIVHNSGMESTSISQKLKHFGIPIHEVLSKKNSLNNKFIPYDTIETEAILFLDDDINLSHTDILVGFWTWQTNRDQLVGFIKGCHVWDVNIEHWLYTYGPCEHNMYSLAHTGAAFLSIYYAYAYTYQMPERIRDKVDEQMYCEDIAMNFLVAHLTQQPPVVVASNVTLLANKKQLREKNSLEYFDSCLNFLVQIYEYMPLLFNQFEVIKCEHRAV